MRKNTLTPVWKSMRKTKESKRYNKKTRNKVQNSHVSPMNSSKMSIKRFFTLFIMSKKRTRQRLAVIKSIFIALFLTSTRRAPNREEDKEDFLFLR